MRLVQFFLFLFFSTSLLENCQYKPEPHEGLEGGTVAHLRKITEQIDDTTLIHADRYKGDWLTHGLHYSEDRFSPLDQISKSNVDSLGLAWSLILGTKRGIETTPLVVDGILFYRDPGAWFTL